jgi:uncharacterized protein YcfJ
VAAVRAVAAAKAVVAARAVATGPARRATPLAAEGETIRRRNRENEKMSDHEVMTLTQNVANPLVQRMQSVADDRGHGGATKGAGMGGMLGAMAGSFWGLGAAVGVGIIGVTIGYLLGEQFDHQDDEE